MKIAVASPAIPTSIAHGLTQLAELAKEAASQQAEIICFPESYIPGYPGTGYDPSERTPEKMQDALEQAQKIAAENSIALVLPMDWFEEDELLNVAFVISPTGEVLGYQTKNQLDPSEDNEWVAGTERHLFEVGDIRFGIVICHEGFRYPESVRWAAQRGAHVVFHPHFNGSNTEGVKLTEWGNKNNPYYEKAFMMRALENTIYFASSNCSSLYPESASAIIAPDGTCIAHEQYGRTGIVVAEIDPAKATGLLAKRFKPELFI